MDYLKYRNVQRVMDHILRNGITALLMLAMLHTGCATQNESLLRSRVVTRTAMMEETSYMPNGHYWQTLKSSQEKLAFIDGIISGVRIMQQHFYSAAVKFHRRAKENKGDVVARAIAVELAYRPKAIGDVIENKAPSISDYDEFYAIGENRNIPIFEVYVYLIQKSRGKAQGTAASKTIERMRAAYKS